VIGHTIVARLFQTANPLGQTIRIKNIPFKVTGVLLKKGANMVGEDQDGLLSYDNPRKCRAGKPQQQFSGTFS
jgi:putative ABC transport system permease protein